jgi:general secretion pathway protein L
MQQRGTPLITEAGAEFYAWWLARLGELIPGARHDSAQRAQAVLIVTPDLSAPGEIPSVTARIERRGQSRRLGRLALDTEGLRALQRAAAPLGRTPETLIEMPAEAILEKRLVLPLAAERDLEQVLSYEMDRETPFAADEVYWGSTVEQRDRARRQIAVRLAMVTKAQLAGLTAALSRAALMPTALIAGKTTIPLAHGATRRNGYATPVLAWACVALAIAAIGVPFLQQSIALDRVNRKIDALQPAVASVEGLRRHAADTRQQIAALAAQRRALGDPLVMLAAVTAALSDDTWLSGLEYSAGKLRLNGQSKAAAHLIGDMSRGAAFKNPEFSTPVTRAEDGKFDIFGLSAEMRN